MPVKAKARKRATKQTSDRISSLAGKGMAHYRANLQAQPDASARGSMRARVVAAFGLTVLQIASCLASLSSQDETRGKRSRRLTAASRARKGG